MLWAISLFIIGAANIAAGLLPFGAEATSNDVISVVIGLWLLNLSSKAAEK